MLNSLSWVRLCLLLHTTGILTVTNGAEMHRFSLEKAEDVEVSSGGSGTGEELPTQPPQAMEAVTRPRSSISNRFANLHLVVPGGNALRRRSDRLFYDPESTIALFPDRDAARYTASASQHEMTYEGGDPSFLQHLHPEEGGTLSAGVDGTTQESATPLRSSCPTKRCASSPRPWSVTRGSRIPVIVPRSRVNSLNSASSYAGSSRATTGSLDSEQGSAYHSLSRPSFTPMQYRLTSTGVSSFCPTLRPSDLPPSPTRPLPNVIVACPWCTHERTLPQTFLAAQPSALVDPKTLSTISIVDEKAIDTSVAKLAQRHRKSGVQTVDKKSSESRAQCPSRVSSGRGSTERSDTRLEWDTGFSAVPIREEHGRPHVEDARDNASAQGSTPQTLVRYHQGTAFPILDENKFLLNQSVQRRYRRLFEVTLPEFMNMVEGLRGASRDAPCFEENLIAHEVFGILANVNGLTIRPLSDRGSPSNEFMPFQVVPEGVLGAGGASLVYQMRVAGDPGTKWAVKVHYVWTGGNPDERSFSYISSSTRDRVTDITRWLSRDYTPSSLFSTFRFLVPYISGEFAGLKPVILSDKRNPQKHLLNLVTVMPVLPGSFDAVLSMQELSSATKRAVCFSFVELVARLHLLKLIHADLKPANFFLGSNGRVYLGDFDTVGKQNSKRQCGSMATLDFLDPEAARCHIKTPTNRVPLTPSRDAWALGLCLFLVWCGAFPFYILNRKSEVGLDEFVTHMLALTPDAGSGDRTTPKLDFENCPGGVIEDGIVLELIQRFLELDRSRRLTPVAGYKLILSAGDFTGEGVRPVFF